MNEILDRIFPKCDICNSNYTYKYCISTMLRKLLKLTNI